MADENPTRMNLALNFGPHDELDMNLVEWLNNNAHRAREYAGQMNQGSHRLLAILETRSPSPETSGGNEPETGEEVSNTCDSCIALLADEFLSRKEDGGKNNVDEGVFYDCNICLDLAKDPVVTCCGHLFCWSCLYRWLNHRSGGKDCPVCKGEVSMKSVTPIYGRGDCIQGSKLDSTEKIPVRPQARRVESSRQTTWRAAATLSVEEMIVRTGSTVEVQRASDELAEGFYLFGDSIRIPRERTPTVEDFTGGRFSGYPPTLSSVINSAPETYYDNNPVAINGEPLPPVDVSSFAAVNNATEHDSTLSVSEPDGGDSRAPARQRRRLI